MAAIVDVLAHTVSGEGPPLLLLNGGLMSYPAWEPLVAPLAAACRLVRCDFAANCSRRERRRRRSTVMPTTSCGCSTRSRSSRRTSRACRSARSSPSRSPRAAPSRVRSLIAMNATERITPQIAERGAPAREAAHDAANGGDGGRVLDLVAETTWSPSIRAGAGRGARGKAPGGQPASPHMVRGTRAADGVAGRSRFDLAAAADCMSDPHRRRRGRCDVSQSSTRARWPPGFRAHASS